MAAMWLLNQPARAVVSDYLIDNADLLAWIPDYHPMAGLTADAIVRQLIGKYLVPNCRIRDQVVGSMESRRVMGPDSHLSWPG